MLTIDSQLGGCVFAEDPQLQVAHRLATRGSVCVFVFFVEGHQLDVKHRLATRGVCVCRGSPVA